jgi:hypothetical protein
MANSVSARFTFECGRCSNIVRRTIVADDDGLFPIPHFACGRCSGKNRLSTMTVTMSDVKCEEVKCETDEKAEGGGLAGCPEVPASGSAAEAVKPAESGRLDSDAAGNPVESAGAGRAARVPEPPKAARDNGKPAK